LFVVVFTVITERKQSEESLRISLLEKTVLLKEVHHRVKNNLQIISSLLNIQTAQARNGETETVLQEMRNRVQSIALLHETLYRSSNLANIDFPAYIDELCTHLLHSSGRMAGRIRMEKRIPPVRLSLEQSVPCGLIVNELICNSLKHAFPEDRKGIIIVEMDYHGGKNLILRISDDGIGLPVGFDIAQTSSLGMSLVTSLAGQLQGRLEVDNSGIGAGFQIVFPLSSGNKRKVIS
jgi:two-component sensor histidine kinase